MYNTAENAIFAAYQRAGNELGRRGPRNGVQTASIDKYEGVAGDIKKSTTSTVTIKWAGPVVLSDGATNLTYNDAVSFTDQIDKMYIGSENTNVKQNKVWKKMYLCEDRMLSFMNSGGHPTKNS